MYSEDIKEDNLWLMKGDCLERMKEIPDGSVDLILTDPPYGTTACKWDSVIPLEPMWNELKRIIKPNGAIVLFGSEPFSSALRMSNIKNYKYDWYWNKNHGANFAQANKRPLNVVETISVFYKKPPTYNSQKIQNPKGEEKRHRYSPSKQKDVFIGQVAMANEYAKKGNSYEPNMLLARSIITFSREHRPIHPTQKPVALMEYLIKTYTNENETVLDFTMGSGTTGLACMNTKRNFIGIERDDKYFDISVKRIKGEL